MDAQPFCVYSFDNSVYQDEEQVDVSCSPLRIAMSTDRRL